MSGTILLGITAGIAAYKSAELVRLMVKDGYMVQVIMTPDATMIMSPQVFQTLSGNPVYVELFDSARAGGVHHIDLGRQSELFVIAPATANTIAKLACGIADNLLTTVALAARCPLLIVPAMNNAMYDHPAVQDNLRILKNRSLYVMEPAAGALACGVEGRGRMPEPPCILQQVNDIFAKKTDYSGIRALVTAGPTREPIDPARYISNYSSGKMGTALGAALAKRGAAVCMVCGPMEVPPPAGVELLRVNTAREMQEAVESRLNWADVIIKAAAVADYRPALSAEQKIKKGGSDSLNLKLVSNPDILAETGARKGDKILVGFAAETNDIINNAQKKLHSKNLDMIVANDLTAPGAGFAADTNRVIIITPGGKTEELPMMSKTEVAHAILDRIIAYHFPERQSENNR